MALQQTTPAVRGNVVNDLSKRVIDLARKIDRLPPGYDYSIELQKPEIDAASWKYEINRKDTIDKGTITNYSPE